MPREKKNSTKVKSPSATNQNGQPKTKKRRGSAAQQQANNQNMQQMQNNYQMVPSNNPYDDYSNPQLGPQSSGMPGNQRMMNMQPLAPNQQVPSQQMGNFAMSNGNHMMQQPNYGNPSQMNGVLGPNGQIMQPINGPMNGPPMSQNYGPTPQQQMNMMSNGQSKMMNASGKQTGIQYPAGQSVISNPNNSSAPPIYVCRVCRHEVNENNQGIMCDSGCRWWYHRRCTNLTEAALTFLNNETFAEWCCDACFNDKSRNIPLVRDYKS